MLAFGFSISATTPSVELEPQLALELHPVGKGEGGLVSKANGWAEGATGGGDGSRLGQGTRGGRFFFFHQI